MLPISRRHLLLLAHHLPFFKLSFAQINTQFRFATLAMSDSSASSKTTSASDSNIPKLVYWHVWTDEAGVSHQTQCELTNFEQQSIAEGTQPQWNNRLLTSETNIMFTVLPVGWLGEWHENPQPQWIVPLSGKWFVETMDGTRVEMGAGEVSFGGDQCTRSDANGHQGHLSGTVGDEPAVLIIAQLSGDRWIAARPGDFS